MKRTFDLASRVARGARDVLLRWRVCGGTAVSQPSFTKGERTDNAVWDRLNASPLARLGAKAARRALASRRFTIVESTWWTAMRVHSMGWLGDVWLVGKVSPHAPSSDPTL